MRRSRGFLGMKQTVRALGFQGAFAEMEHGRESAVVAPVPRALCDPIESPGAS